VKAVLAFGVPGVLLGLSATDVSGVLIPGTVVALLEPESWVPVVGRASELRPGRVGSAGVEALDDALAFPLPLFTSGCMLSSLRVSIGKSATPIIICVAVPTIAVAPPVMGSHGPSSVSYSRGRYLSKLAYSSVVLFRMAYNLRSLKLSSPA
jgi:hypothetical protein